MATVYRKTAKGQQEVETRTHGLMPRLRTALILVDGRRDEETLYKLMPGDPQATIKSLLDEGYIEPAAPAVERRATPRLPDAAALRPAAPAEARTFEQHRQAAVRTINDALGPSGEAAALKLERCKTWDELLPALEFARSILANARGAQVGEEFRRQFIATPPAP